MLHAISEMSGYALAGVAVLLVLMVWLLGSITNMVLRDRGFGVIINGLVMLIGFGGGIYARYLMFGAL